MIGKKITITNTTRDKCEDLNDQQIKIYENQIKFVEENIKGDCKKYWELIDKYLKGYYYDYIHEIDTDKEVVIRFDLLLMFEEIKCEECFNLWDQYVDMEDQRFRLDLKKMKCYEKLTDLENNEKMWDKFL